MLIPNFSGTVYFFIKLALFLLYGIISFLYLGKTKLIFCFTEPVGLYFLPKLLKCQKGVAHKCGQVS